MQGDLLTFESSGSDYFGKFMITNGVIRRIDNAYSMSYTKKYDKEQPADYTLISAV